MATRIALGPLQSRTVLGDSVYEVLSAHLLDQRLEAGERLSIDALARELKVSPTPVREALARLEAQGMVTKEPLRGYRVTHLLSPKAFDELFEVRFLLEPPAARRAAEHRTNPNLRALDVAAKHFARSQARLGPSSDPADRSAAYRDCELTDAAFHEQIAIASGSDVLRRTIVQLRPHLQLYRLPSGPFTTATLDEHARIQRAIADRDPAQAERAMAEHIETAARRLRPILLELTDGES
jgi:DNA-binding GntR family transcriptional regulator